MEHGLSEKDQLDSKVMRTREKECLLLFSAGGWLYCACKHHHVITMYVNITDKGKSDAKIKMNVYFSYLLSI